MTAVREPVITEINGRFRAKLYVLKAARIGERKYEYDWGSTAAEARAASYERQRQQGAIPISALRKAEITVDLWIGQHLQYLRTIRGCRESSVYTYRKLHELYIRPMLGTIKLKDISPAHIAQMQQRMADATLSVARIRATTNFLGHALRRAYKQEIITRNPVDLLDRLPSKAVNGKAVLAKDDLDRLLQAFAGTWWYDHVLLLVYTGMRRGEMLGLRRCDVDLQTNVITVRCSLVDNGTALQHQEYAKTESGQRRIALAPRLVEMLRTRLEWTAVGGIEGPLFPGRDGRWQRPNSFNITFARKMREIGLKAWPHLLRHSHASILLRETGNLAQVSKHLGHSNTAITASVYAHAMQDVDHALATAIGEALK